MIDRWIYCLIEIDWDWLIDWLMGDQIYLGWGSRGYPREPRHYCKQRYEGCIRSVIWGKSIKNFAGVDWTKNVQFSLFKWLKSKIRNHSVCSQLLKNKQIGEQIFEFTFNISVACHQHDPPIPFFQQGSNPLVFFNPGFLWTSILLVILFHLSRSSGSCGWT